MWNDGCVFFFQVNSDSNLQPWPIGSYNDEWLVGSAWFAEALCYWWRSSGQVIRGRVDDEFMAKGDSARKFSVVLSDRENQRRLHLISMVCWAGAIFYFTFYLTKDIIASLRRAHDDDIRGPKKGRLKQGCYLSLFPIQAHGSPECHPTQATKGCFFFESWTKVVGEARVVGGMHLPHP